jgi:caspase 7
MSLSQEMVDLIVRESQHREHGTADSFILALFSHGAPGVVYGTDFKEVRIDEVVISAFDGKNCPLLAGKPKLIIIQACQGSA